MIKHLLEIIDIKTCFLASFLKFFLEFLLPTYYHITMRKKLLLFVFIPFFYFLFPASASAVCPVCTIAVGAGLGISRTLGIDDAVTSVWIGGLILSMSFWFIDWVGKKRNKPLTAKWQLLTTLLMYIFVLLPLWFGKYIGRPLNTIYSFDKILFGTLWGSLAFLLGKWADEKVRQEKGKQLFVYQKVIFPVSSLIITSVILYLLTA